MEEYDVLIVGIGPAGLGAALYAARYKLKTIAIGKIPGGLMSETSLVENYLGFKSISGMELSMKMVEHAEHFGAKILQGINVTRIEKEGNKFKVFTEDNKSYLAKAIVLAHGMQRRKLQIPGEQEFLGKGVSYCATCDAYFYRDKIVAVIGGANSAVSAALLLSDLAKKVYVIYRRKPLRAEPVLVERLLSKRNVEVIYETNVIEIIGDEYVKAVKLDKPYKGSNILQLDGVFVEIGFVPSKALVEPLGVSTDERGFVIVDKEQRTNVPGVFAAGDCCNASNLKQILVAAAQGIIAATSAYNYIKSEFGGGA